MVVVAGEVVIAQQAVEARAADQSGGDSQFRVLALGQVDVDVVALPEGVVGLAGRRGAHQAQGQQR
ncbi:hypothetical protein D3C84_992420 [compost metagenome]